MQEDNSQLVIEDGVFNGEDFKLIKFYFKHKQYVVIFTKVESAKNPPDITLKENELGLVYQSNSFEVKFDLVDNFESGHYYQKPASTYTFRELMALGMLLCNSIQFHFRLTGASAYYAIAENSKLKSFYDLLDKKCKNMVAFTVVDKLGSEGLGYEIRTTNYKN
jgi:hypothetical protein